MLQLGSKFEVRLVAHDFEEVRCCEGGELRRSRLEMKCKTVRHSEDILYPLDLEFKPTIKPYGESALLPIVIGDLGLQDAFVVLSHGRSGCQSSKC